MKKAFTIVELLTIIVILGVLATITMPVIGKIMDSSKNNLYKEQINKIIEASKRYTAENIFLLPDNEEKLYVKVNQLQLEGYLTKNEIINPKDGSTMSGCIEIIYIQKGNQYTYNYINECPQ